MDTIATTGTTYYRTKTLCGTWVTLAVRAHKGHETGREYWPLTDCCHSPARNAGITRDNPSGLACDACGEPVPEWTVGPLRDACAAHGCPCPDSCADDARWQLDCIESGY
jgi:hypothetical protein